VTALLGAPERLPLISPGWDKRSFDVRALGLAFQDAPLSIGVVYVLDGTSVEGATLTPLTGHRALMALVANTYVGYLATPEMKRAEMAVLERLVAATPIRAVRAEDLEARRAAIRADLAGRPASAHV
jgi:hypothetical protein